MALALQAAAPMRDHSLNLLLATFLFGTAACTDADEAASGSEGMITATVDGEVGLWTSKVAANDSQFHGLVILYGSDEDGQGVRLTVPNEAGTYACADAVLQDGGFMSVNILFVEGAGSPPAMTSMTDPDCSITLERVPDGLVAGWAGTFSGVLWRPDAGLAIDERRIAIENGFLEVSRAVR